MSWGNETTKKASRKKQPAEPKFVCEWKHGSMLVFKHKGYREIAIAGYIQRVADADWPYEKVK